MRRISHYKVLNCEGASKLERSVQVYLDDGWEPYGPLIIIKDSFPQYIQPMVKYTEDENPRETTRLRAVRV